MREGSSTQRCLNELQLLFHLHRIEKHPIMRYIGFATEIAVKTAGASHSVVSASLRGVAPIMFGVIARDDHMEDHQTARFIREGAYLVGFRTELTKKAFEQIG